MTFLRTLAITLLASVALTAAVGAVSGAWTDAAIGAGVSLAASLVVLAVIHLVLEAGGPSMSRFMGAVFGGMLLRMVLLGAGLAAVLKLLGGSAIVFVVAFFLVYLVSQILEIRYVHLAGRARAAA
jgi:hypothetical protein